jgi:dipeptidyl aminopeptidase/acylaminoacyl peptidase
VVDFCGPTDFTGENRFEGGRRPNAVDQLFGANVEDVPEKAEAASPVTYVDADDPPFLIVHGTDDPVVPFDQAKRLAGRLKQAGVEVTLVPIEGGGHGVGGPGVHGRVAAFLARHLRGKDVEVSDEPIKPAK